MSVRRTVAALLVCQCVLTAGLTLSLPFFALYLNQRRGYAMDVVGAAIFLMMLGSAAGQSLGGEFSDLLGSRRVMQWAIAARAVLSGLTAIAIALDGSAVLIVGLSVVSAFLGSFFEPAVRSWVTDACPPGERLGAFSRLRVAINLGWAVGPAVGGLLAARSYPALFASSAAVCFIALIVLRFAVGDYPARRHGQSFRWKEPLKTAADLRFTRLCALGLVMAAVHAQLVVGLSVHAVRYGGLSEAQVGLLFATNGLVVVLLQNAAARRITGRSLAAAVAAGCVLYGVGYAGIGFARGFPWMAGFIVIATLGEIVVAPGVHTLATNMAPETLRGRYLGFYGLMHQLGGAAGPLLGGLGLRHLSPLWAPAPWLVVGAIGTAASLGFLGLRRSLTGKEDGMEAA